MQLMQKTYLVTSSASSHALSSRLMLVQVRHLLTPEVTGRRRRRLATVEKEEEEEEEEKEEEKEKGGIVTALASNLQQLGKTGQRLGGDRCVRSSCKIVELWRA